MDERGVSMTIPSLTKRAVKGSPLNTTEGDKNWSQIEDSMNALLALFTTALNADGTIKNLPVIPLKSTTGNDTYVVTTTKIQPATEADMDGVVVVLEVDTDNLGAATLQFNALPARSIKKFKDQDLDSKDIKAGMKAVLIFQAAATRWELVNPATAGRVNFLADTGTSSAYQLTPGAGGFFAEPGAYYEGYTVWFKAGNTNVANATLRVGTTLAAQSLKKRVVTAAGAADRNVLAGEIVAGGFYEAMWSNSAFFLLSPLSEYEQTDAVTIPSAAGKRSYAHNFGKAPGRYHVMALVDNTGDVGFAIGDETPAERLVRSADLAPAVTVFADATNIHVVTYDGTYRAVKPDGTGGLTAAFTASRWKFKVYAQP